MNKINVAIIDEHPVLKSAFMSLLSDAKEIEVIESANNVNTLLEKMLHLPSTFLHVLIYNIYSPSDIEIENIRRLKKAYGRIPVLVIAMYYNELFILKSIKAGAKGILSDRTSRDEIVQAIYTMRNGYEYLGKTITGVVLNSYLNRSGLNGNAKENLSQLSSREIEVLTLYCEGHSNQEIADKLFISIRTVETHKTNIMKKINLRSSVDLVKFAIRNNLIEV
ncbi:MAG: response regulator transcription factor [Sphingobacteriia bacterium]|nr:response regulator transcription factor [Sphingobacteriia bacterium]